MLGDIGFLHSRLSLMYQVTQNLVAAAEHGRQALEISERFAAEDPTNINYRRAVLSARATLALLEVYHRNGAEAVKLAKSMLHDTVAASAADPENVRLRGEIATAWNTVGYAHFCRGDYEAADRAWREILPIQEDLALCAPAAGQVQLGMATTCLQLAAAAGRREKFDEQHRNFARLFDLLGPIDADGRLHKPLFRMWWESRGTQGSSTLSDEA